MAPELNLMQQ